MLGNQPRCNKCGRFHTGECPPDLRTCYICHKQGHIASNCPQVQKRGPGRVPARVYTMTQEEADRKDSTVICGNVSLLGLVTYVLIDSGATHSFISKTLVESLGIKPETLAVGYLIVVPSGEYMESTSLVKQCPIQIEDRSLEADLILLDLQDFDLILRMDWLSKYGAHIDCRGKRVVFNLLGGEQLEFKADMKFQPIPIISAVKARKMLGKGCTGYLAHVLDSQVEQELKPKDIEVVQEYLDVFPESLTTLPPEREVEFEIERSEKDDC